jgi:hypothetical protein
METLIANPYLLIALVLWTIPWQAWSLWLSARRGEVWWFLVMTILNTIGLLNIFYIFVIAKQSDKKDEVRD